MIKFNPNGVRLSKYVLGLNVSGFISSACLLQDGEIIAGSSEERFSRIKRDNSFPHKAIKFCLKEAGINFDELDCISSGWNPRFYLKKNINSLNNTLKERSLFLHYIANELGSSEYIPTISEINEKIKLKNGKEIQIEFIDHHLAHAAYAFHFSGLQESLVLSLDGFGEVHSGGIFHFTNQSYKNLAFAKFPHSLGMIYSSFTQFFGFRPNSDEWRVMALSGLGKNEYYKEIDDMIKVSKNAFNNLLEIDLSFFDFYNFFTPEYYSDKFIEVFGNPLSNAQQLTQKQFDMARSLQTVMEDKVFEILNDLKENYSDQNNICLTGGFFMNSALNGKISSRTNFHNPQIGPCPDDSGISIGSAFFSSRKLNMVKSKKYIHDYFGPTYSNTEIKEILKICKLQYEELDNHLIDAAKNLADGKIIGWFQGRSEFGQRSLGNRSILASPIFPWMKDAINKYIKFREEFRPFAPSILDGEKTTYFEIGTNEDVLFMEKVFVFKENVKNKIPSVVHYDGTGRLHTVTKKSNEVFFRLIEEFKKITGIPIVLNTSFNTNDVPIVNSPRDAIDSFFKSGLDILYLNNIKILK